ncbi:hypothetical protein BCT12_14460 [Vibrio breoganii]|nr:hypothetical protein BCT12_14460 [Vibrio breoganii]
MVFAVSDYYKYHLIEASSPDEAVCSFTGKSNLVLLSNERLNDPRTVVAVMCCKYEGYIEGFFESLEYDVDRVLIMNRYNGTWFYQYRN